MSEALLVAVAGLLVLPSAVRRLRFSLAPAEWATINAGSLVGGVVLLELAVVVCAIPLAASIILGGQRQHFFPGGIVAGWISLFAAVLIPASIAFGTARLLIRRRSLRVQPWLGNHRLVDGVDLVVVPTAAELAFSLPGHPPQVIISEGLVETLTEIELQAVIRHEMAHIRHHHSMYLLVVAALSPLFGRLGFVRSSLRSLELSIECWADAAAAPSRRERRSTSSALLALCHIDLKSGVAAFSRPDLVAMRLQALAPDRPLPGTKIRSVLYGTIALLFGVPIAALLAFTL